MTLTLDQIVATASTPWWMEDALRDEAEGTALSPLSERIDADVAVVGGGYTGMWTAWLLKTHDPSLDVVLLEGDECGLGPSGRNGGFVHGYWGQLGQLVDLFGPEKGLTVARAADEAQQAILDFCRGSERDLWLNVAGITMMSATPEQDTIVRQSIAVARRLGVLDEVRGLSGAEAREFCDSPRFRSGVHYRHGATVQPARLARELRRRAVEVGVRMHEHSPVTEILDSGDRVEVSTARGRVRAERAVIATGAALTGERHIRSRVVNFSSHMILTEPVPELIEELGWTDGVGIFDARMFVHYLRTTPDGRIAIGSGSGHIGYGGRINPSLYADRQAVARARRGLEFLLPSLKGVGIERAWGGPIDVSGDGLPFIRPSRTGRVLRAGGFSGHGVNPSYLIGRILTSLVLGRRDSWGRLPLVRRTVPRFPPEPFRWVGGNAVRLSIARVEDGQQGDVSVNGLQRFVANLPARLGMKIGTR
ncbi:NAD(P)/FAD-dependent oxidoreductase [Actinomadura luteofluorescens]|uniref:Glycine/D-amino acid oxidase-like deaminating enzyme n=1 Tax=Actinomadura luteofluorescens TaxID=46163 RepID=A0A7Y9ECE3_9ACTN|nr:FAD-dependent oxidoreductase [Actinomadura luteofluorescens]NYD45184.1 glycine/D-amino acid oxidase-like deaminating enzyme [Actinomadura luteofluorescens]